MSGPRKGSSQGDGRRWTVFVRFPDQKTAQRITPDGHSTRRRVHAAQFTTAERAEQVAATCQAYLVTRDLSHLVVTGTARHLVTDQETAAFPGLQDDVRDCLLRVTLSTGFEAFWPVSELVVDYAAAMFVIHED